MDKDKSIMICSPSITDVEAATQKSKRESDDDDSLMVILKKQRMEDNSEEIKAKDNSFAMDEYALYALINTHTHKKEVYEIVKTLLENSLKKSDLEDILSKVKETPNKKGEPMYECCFGTDGIPVVNSWNTIFVKGFDCTLSRDDIKSTLKKLFGSCGEVTRVFVPIECQTGSPLGFAFLNLKEDAEKALKLDGSVLGEFTLEVAMAREREENSAYPNFKGCTVCSMASHQAPYRIFYENHFGRKFSPSEFEGPRGELGMLMRSIVNDGGEWPDEDSEVPSWW